MLNSHRCNSTTDNSITCVLSPRRTISTMSAPNQHLYHRRPRKSDPKRQRKRSPHVIPAGTAPYPDTGREPRENKARKIPTSSFPISRLLLNPSPKTSSGPSLNVSQYRQRKISSETNATSARNPSISPPTSSALSHGTSKSKSSTQSPPTDLLPYVRATAQVRLSPLPS